ncbi:MAG: SDR family oxidoreductase [Candidatus Caenarcaniphilales bacterium]|nr:SDR family oxidoreductase [Candidatus Caenarcaniphilales bacterium]
MDKSKPIVVTGGTGYVGARLIPRLLDSGYKVRAVSRSLTKLMSRPWAKNKNLEIVAGDLHDLESITHALKGCSTVYYFVHSMNSNKKDFQSADRVAAKNMVKAAEQNEIERIIYLGGLGNSDKKERLSPHLESRIEVGEILKSGKVPVTILRAAMIIGSGSTSFEILRYLVDRLPLMITPKWVNTPSQPIAIRNVLNYLIGCLDVPETIGKSFDIGGEEIVNYRDLMKIYEEEAKLPQRFVIPVPVFTPWLSSHWIHLITPIPSSMAIPLTEGLKNKVICENQEIRKLIPQELLSCRDAIKKALKRLQMQQVESHWSDAGYSYPPEWVYYGDPEWAGGTIFEDKRKIVLEASKEDVWEPLIKIGGRNGWYQGDWLWKLRGAMDGLIGGVGLKRGRRHDMDLRPGDALDFWRVADLKRNQRLLLVAEMKLPGEAILDSVIEEVGDGKVELKQIARFLPRGLLGLIYWYLVTPFHFIVFNGMLKGIAEETGKKILEGPKKFS